MASFATDYNFGVNQESMSKINIERYLNTSLISRGGYSIFDFDDGADLFVELKTRRIPHNKYPTAIIGANKIEIAKKNPDKTYWFVYKYQDGLFGIKYSEEFDSYETRSYSRGDRNDYDNKPQNCYFIPTSALSAF